MPEWWEETKEAWKAVPGDIPRAAKEAKDAIVDGAKKAWGWATSKHGKWGGGDTGGEGAGE